MQIMNRPLGVTLLAILHVLQAIVAFVVGFALVAVGAFLPRFLFRMPRLFRYTGLVEVIGGIVIIVALLYLLLSYGLWSGKAWAWTVSLIFAGLGVILSLIALIVRGGLGAVVGLILDVMIIYYLTRINVKAFFGKAQFSTYASILQPTSLPQPMHASDAPRFCVNCGAPVTADVKFCSHCGSKLA